MENKKADPAGFIFHPPPMPSLILNESAFRALQERESARMFGMVAVPALFAMPVYRTHLIHDTLADPAPKPRRPARQIGKAVQFSVGVR